jgi:hypothetical protein
MRDSWQNLSANGFWDKTGALVSWACAAHCLAMPLLVSSFPLVGLGFLAHDGVEYIFIGVSIFVALISILSGFLRFHRNIYTLMLFAGGIGLMLSADGIFEESFLWKTIFVVVGASLISTAHILNRFLCRKCANCGETGCRLSAE